MAHERADAIDGRDGVRHTPLRERWACVAVSDQGSESSRGCRAGSRWQGQARRRRLVILWLRVRPRLSCTVRKLMRYGGSALSNRCGSAPEHPP